MANGGGGQSHKGSVAISSVCGVGGWGGVVNVSVRLIPGFVHRDFFNGSTEKNDSFHLIWQN